LSVLSVQLTVRLLHVSVIINSQKNVLLHQKPTSISHRPLQFQYSTTEEFNMDSKAECVQLNVAHVARKNIKKKKLKQTIKTPVPA